MALTNATLPYILQIAGAGVQTALLQNEALRAGVNVANGEITYAAVAKSLGYEYVAVENALKEKAPIA